MTDLKTRLHDILPKGASIGCDWFVESAQNATLKATDGREFIDFAGGIGVVNTGHRHPKVVTNSPTPHSSSPRMKAISRWPNGLSGCCRFRAKAKSNFSRQARKRWKTR